MRFTALLDTSVLYPALLRDVLLSLAHGDGSGMAGTYRPLWSQDILDELGRNLREKAGLDAERTARLVGEMSREFPDALVEHYEPLVPAMPCHWKDRHVMAAAVRGGASTIVTHNLTDFPPDDLVKFDLEAQHPDTFLSHQYDLSRQQTMQAVEAMLRRWRNPVGDIAELTAQLSRNSCPRFAQLLTQDSS